MTAVENSIISKIAAIRKVVDANGKRPIPVIADGKYCNSLAISSALGVNGIKSITIDHSANAIAFGSKYTIGLRCPDPLTEPANLILFLETLGNELKYKGIFFFTDDIYLKVVSEASESLQKYFIYPFSGYEQLSKIMDKKFQYECALKAGFPAPVSYFVESQEEFDKAIEKIPFPAVLKSRSRDSGFGRLVAHAFKINTKDEAAERYKVSRGYRLILQEYIPGDDKQLFTFGSYLDKDSDPLGVFTGRKLLQTNAGIGTCRIGESLEEEQLIDEGIKLLRAMKYHGASQLEVKKDPRDGKFKLMEVNVRYWKWHSLATACGVNLPYIQYQDAVGMKPGKIISKANHKLWRESIIHALLSFNRVFKGELSLADFFKSLSPGCVDSTFSFRDPRPGLLSIYTGFSGLSSLIDEMDGLWY